MIVTELSKGIKLYLLVGGKGERLSSVTNGTPKPLVNIKGKPFINYVLDDLKGFDVTLVCSDSTYDYFKNLDIDVFNEGDRAGTGGFLMKLGESVPDSFYVMNGDTYFTGDLNLDTDESTVFVAEELVTDDNLVPRPPTSRYNLIPFDNSVTIIFKMLCRKFKKFRWFNSNHLMSQTPIDMKLITRFKYNIPCLCQVVTITIV